MKVVNKIVHGLFTKVGVDFYVVAPDKIESIVIFVRFANPTEHFAFAARNFLPVYNGLASKL